MTKPTLRSRGSRAVLPREIGPELDAILKHEILSISEEVELLRQVALGDRCARNRLLSCNLRLVMSVARCFQNKGIPLEDLLQEGCIGFLRAVDKFDPAQGCRLSTYATWWIRQGIVRAVEERGRLVRRPVYAYRVMAALKSCIAKARAAGIEPTLDELIAHVREVYQEAPRSENSKGRRPELSPDVVRACLTLVRSHVVSIDQATGGESGEQDFTTLLPAAEPAEHIASDEKKLLLQEVKRLPKRDQLILIHRFGIGRREHTLQEVADILRLSRERVRQIEELALRRLRRNERLKRMHTAEPRLSLDDMLE